MPIGCLVFGFGELDIPGDWFLAPGDISINGDTHSQLTAANVTKERGTETGTTQYKNEIHCATRE